MKHPKDRLERLYINAKKDRRKKRKGQEDAPTETEDFGDTGELSPRLDRG